MQGGSSSHTRKLIEEARAAVVKVENGKAEDRIRKQKKSFMVHVW